MQRENEPVSPFFISNATANVISAILCGTPREFDDPYLDASMQMIRDWLMAMEESSPYLVPKYYWKSKEATARKVARKRRNVAREFFMKDIEDHVATLDPHNPRDFIDAYIINRGVDNINFNDHHLVDTIIMLQPDAIDAVGLTMIWILFYLTYYPHIQQRIQKEIDEVVGRTRKPSVSDKPNLPLVEAIVLEATRMAPIYGISLRHSNRRAVNFRG